MGKTKRLRMVFLSWNTNIPLDVASCYVFGTHILVHPYHPGSAFLWSAQHRHITNHGLHHSCSSSRCSPWVTSLCMPHPPKTGFLVIAPDRGALGNQDVRALFEEFKASYVPASLVFVGRDYKGLGSEYFDYISQALVELRHAGAPNVVAIPFFLFDADAILQKVKTSLPAYGHADHIRWAQTMSENDLIGQVIAERAVLLSREPDHEPVVLVGFGATDTANEQAMHADLQKLSDYLARYRHFHESRTLVYYDQASPMAETKNAGTGNSHFDRPRRKEV